MSTLASTLWQDGGTHIDGPLYVDGIPLSFVNTTSTYLRGDGVFATVLLPPTSTVTSTLVTGGFTIVIVGGLITSIST